MLLGVLLAGAAVAITYFLLADSPATLQEREVNGSGRLASNEVTVAEYSTCVDRGACPVPGTVQPIEGVEGDVAKHCNFGNPSRETHPMNCLSRDEATAYCRFVGGDLPSWELYEAAFSRAPQPSGGGWANHCENACSNPVEEPAPEYSGKCPLLACDSEDRYPTTAPVGQFVKQLPGALADLYGNVAEWTSTLDANGLAVVAGSAWSSPWDTIAASIDRRLAPETRRPDVGLRCELPK